MSDPSIGDIITRLSEAIVMAEPEDLPVLGKVHADLGSLSLWARKSGKDEIRKQADDAAETVEKIIFREYPDPAQALVTIAKFLSEVQRVDYANSDIASADAGVSESFPAEVEEATQVDEAVQLAGEPFAIQGDLDLLSDFIGEAREHLENADNELLTLESTPEESESLNAVFRAFHTIKGVAGFLALLPVQQLAHETETLLDKARKGNLALTGAAMDVTFEANDLMKELIESIAEAMGQDGNVAGSSKLPGLLMKIRKACEGGDAVATQPATQAPAEGTTLGADDDIFAEPEKPEASPSPEPVPAAQDAKPNETPATPAPAPTPAQAKAAPAPTKQRFSGIVQETIKVDARRLDSLIDTIGEMVIAEAMVRQSFIGSEEERLRIPQILGQLDKITRELQELAMSLRMVPVRSTFQRMARLARDTAKKLSKPVEFVTNGDDTELDKTVVDVIGDPLVHMIRNAVDHGLESSAEERVAAGKPEKGRVELSARHQGGSIIIEIRDDGKGLDRDVLLRKGIDRGLVQEGQVLSDSEVYALIFEPGFSTAKKVTDVSGRGVGLDVVRKNIQSLRGKVEISSTLGKGSTFSIRLPLTLAIIEGMVVRAGGQRYIIPTLSITRMIRHSEVDVSSVLKCDEMVGIGDELIPLFHLDDLFDLEKSSRPMSACEIIVVEDNGKNHALVIDEILGQQQIVIKPLGQMFKGISGVSGGAIMPDGLVGLILDISGLIAMAGRKNSNVAA